MSQKNIDFGSFPNDPSADAIRTAFQKVEQNFTELYAGQEAQAVLAVNKTPGAGITVNSPTGNVVVSAKIAQVQIQTTTLGVGTGGSNTANYAVIFDGSTPIRIDIPETINNVGNINLANTLTANFVVANANVSANNITASANISANRVSANNITIAANANAVNVNATTGNFSGNVAAANFTGINISLTGNLTAANGNVNAANASFTGNIISANANLGNLVTANYFQGDGGLLSNVFAAANSQIQLGTSNVRIPTANGNVTVSIGGTSNVVVVTGTGINVAGTLNATGNANVGNLGAANGIFSGNLTTANLMGVHANGNSNVNIPVANGNVTVSIGGTSNVMVVTGTGINVAGTLNATGNANVGNLGVVGNTTSGNINVTSTVTTSRLVSNIATGTAPFTVTSTTRVSNLNVEYANVADFINVSTQSTGNAYLLLGNALSGNITETANSVFVANTSNGALYATTFVGTLSGAATSAVTAGTITTNAQPNITSVGTLSSLSVTGNITTGNISGILANGTSNVSIPASGGNVNISAGATPNVAIVTGSGVNIAGTLNVTGNANVGNLGATNGVLSTSLATPLVQNGNSNISLTANGNIIVNAIGGERIRLTSSGANISGTLNATGNANVGNVGATNGVFTGTLGVTGNANIGNLGTTQLLASANVTAPQLISNVVTGTAPFIVTSTTQVANLNVANSGYAMVAGTATSAANSAAILSNVQSTGTYYPAFISGTSNGNYALASNTQFSANIANGWFGASLIGGTLTTAAQPNITSVGTLNALTVTGNISAANINGTHYGAATGLTGIPGANVIGTVANASYATNSGSATTSTTAGTVTTAAQPNITSLGTLSALTISGNLSAGNANLGNAASANFFVGDGGLLSNITASTGSFIVNGTSNVVVDASSNVRVSITGTANAMVISSSGTTVTGILSANTISANLLTGTLTTSSQPNVISLGTLTGLTVNGISNLGSAGNVKITGGSNSQILTTDGSGNLSWITATSLTFAPGANTQLLFNDSGNFAASGLFTFNKVSGNANVGNIGATNGVFNAVTGSLTTNAQPNITSIGTLSSLLVNGNINANNISLNNTLNVKRIDLTGDILTSSLTSINLVQTWNNSSVTFSPFVANITDTASAADSKLIDLQVGGSSKFNVNKTGNVTFGGTLIGNAAGIFAVQAGNIVGTVANSTAANTVLTNTSSSTTAYPTFSLSSSNGFTQNYVANGISANLANSALIATTFVGSLSGSATTATTSGTVTTAAQPNITSVGTLTSLGVSGNVTAGNIVGTLANGNSTVSIPSANGNISITTNGSEKILITASGNVGISNSAPTHTLSVTGTMNVSGNANIGNIGATNGAFANISGNGAGITFANASNISGTLPSSVTNAISNTGTITSGTWNSQIGSSATFVAGLSGANLSALSAANISGTVASATVAETVSNVSQPNITSVSSSFGNLTLAANNSITLSGTTSSVTGANLVSANFIAGNGASLTGLNASNISSGILAQARLANSSLTVNGTTVSLGGTSTITANTTQPLTLGNYLLGTTFDGGTAVSTAVDATTTATANKVVARDANANIYANNISGTLITAAQTNITSVSSSFGNLTLAANNSITLSGANAKVTGANLVSASFVAGTLTTAAQPNITSVSSSFGNLTLAANNSITMSGANANVTGANLVSANFVAANGSLLTSLNASNISSGTLAQARLANSSLTVNGTAITLGSSGTVTANTTQTLTLGTYLTGTSFNGGTAVTTAVDATTTATANKIVARDANANIYANNISGTLITASQPNITSVSSSFGNLTLAANNSITLSGANAKVTGANLVSAGFFTGNGASLTGLNASNISSGTIAQARLANSTITLNGTTLTLGGTSTVTSNTTQILTLGSYLTGTSFNGGTAVTTAVDATTTATANKIVARDANANIAANYFIGNGSQLTGIVTSVSNIVNGNSNINIASAGANTTVSVNGTSNVLVISNTSANFTSAMTVSGNVGIGTTSPGVALDVIGTLRSRNGAANTVRIVHDGTNGTIASSSNMLLYADGTNNIILHTNASERMRISSTGNVGIGTNAPSYTLDVTGNSRISGSLGIGTAPSGTTGEIRATNNITAYYSSDNKFKENVTPIENALDKVDAIGGKTFDWTDEYIEAHGGEDGYFIRKQDFGVIAQDVQQVFPLAVRERQDGSLAVDYEKLCALAFQAIKELKIEIDMLKGRLP